MLLAYNRAKGPLGSPNRLKWVGNSKRTLPHDGRVMMTAKAKRAKIAAPIEIESSSSNVFEDLGLPDAAARLAKAELARVIRTIVSEKGWTQRRAAEALGIAPPDMSDLVRGKLARFSQERLERFLNALDMDIRIQVGPRRKGKKHANVTVELVAAL